MHKNHRNAPKVVVTGNSLYFFGPLNRFRLFFANIVRNSYFEAFIYQLILLNSIVLMLQDPGLKDKYCVNTIETINNWFSFAFIAEVTIKIIAMGFVKGKHSYL